MKYVTRSAALAAVLCLLSPPVLRAGKPVIIGTDPAKPAAHPSADPSPAAVPAEPDTPDKIVSRFFAYLQRREVDQAYDQLTRGTKIAERPDDVKMLKSKTKDALAVFGAVQGYEIVKTKKVGEHLLSQSIISIGKEFPLEWKFYFYKPADTWRLIDLRVEERLSTIFEEDDVRQGGAGAGD